MSEGVEKLWGVGGFVVLIGQSVFVCILVVSVEKGGKDFDDFILIELDVLGL